MGLRPVRPSTNRGTDSGLDARILFLVTRKSNVDEALVALSKTRFVGSRGDFINGLLR